MLSDDDLFWLTNGTFDFKGGSSSGGNCEGGPKSNLGCGLFIIIVGGLLAFLLFGNLINGCYGVHEDISAVDSDSIADVDTTTCNFTDTVLSEPKKITPKQEKTERKISTHSTYYSDDDEYDEDGMYKDEDEDIKDKREYDDYDDDEADDWE